MCEQTKLQKLCRAAVIGALYAAVTLLLAPISYGNLQCRVSEALCILPWFFPETAWGLFAGCLLANLYTGSVMDMIFGTLATFLAGVMTAYFGKKGNTVKNRMLGCGMPVAFNAVIVGAVLTWAYQLREFSDPLASFAFNGLTVGLGEAGVLYLIGYPLLVSLPKMKVFREFMDKFNIT